MARKRPRPGPEAASDDAAQRRGALADAILETSPLGIAMVNRAGRIVRANDRLARTFGYEQKELEGQALETLLPERLRAVHVTHRDRFFTDPRVRPMGLGLELEARRKDGREFPVEISLSFIRSDDEMLALAFVTDITPRRNAERRLQAEFVMTRVFAESHGSAEFYPRLLQGLCESLDWDLGELWRLDGDVLRYEAGWHRADLDTQEFDAISRETILPHGTGLAGQAWQAERALWMGENVLVRPRARAAAALGLQSACALPIRGERAWSHVMVLLGREAREPDDALLAMLTDIGSRIGQHLDHRRAEMKLRHQREALYQSEKLSALGQLVAGVAHEMNNPLSIISSRIELMLGEAEGQALSPQHLEDLKVVHRNVLRVAGVAQALRSFARQSTGERRPVNLNMVVAETLLLVGKPSSTDNIRIATALDPALPPLLGNANALQQVLLNLLTNAREAMVDGGEIGIETGLDPARPGRLRLVVRDTGPGIPAMHAPHLFEPFYTTKPSGTGLGLAVSYGIVQEHLGTIDVQSAPGQGATFVLSFPALEGSPATT
ncbi:MAG TPA: ATP-binding protein [Gemmatimonadota bacterium]|jgi:PAS domain S-box-containing protein|nr:ATP-binding protein [Gemmatimonadota bacterium]